MHASPHQARGVNTGLLSLSGILALTLVYKVTLTVTASKEKVICSVFCLFISSFSLLLLWASSRETRDLYFVETLFHWRKDQRLVSKKQGGVHPLSPQTKWCDAVEQPAPECLIPPQALDAGRNHRTEATVPWEKGVFANGSGAWVDLLWKHYAEDADKWWGHLTAEVLSHTCS